MLREGLKRMRRNHVHLSPTGDDTARRRLPWPVVLEVGAHALRRDGHDLFLSENGAWLVERVPPRCLERL